MPAGPAEQDRRQWLVDSKSGGVVGALALLLASIGAHGVVSYGVSQRTREIGMDMTRSLAFVGVLLFLPGIAFSCELHSWAQRHSPRPGRPPKIPKKT